MSEKHCVIIGSGIIGQAHALEAKKAGLKVTLLERDSQPLGASVRNFGTLWPIGCRPGPEREQALYGVRRWRELAKEAGFFIDPSGSVSLAHREEAMDVLEEFGQTNTDYELLTADETVSRFPMANPKGLRGALYSSAETVVRPASTMAAMTRHLIVKGVKVRFDTLVTQVHDDCVETSGGERVPFDQLVIAAGKEMRLLFPEELAAAELHQCRLQMMRTRPLAPKQALGAVMVGDLTLCHYPAFEKCRSIEALRTRLKNELPQHHAHGIHVIAAQHEDGSLTLGDSHEFGRDFEPGYDSEVEELILGALAEFAQLPERSIAARWQGTYLKSKKGITQVILSPQENVTMVTAMGGLGMTLSWGLAKRTVQSWSLNV
jgi:D-hydroxyproline dehydrogenase subunit beta